MAIILEISPSTAHDMDRASMLQITLQLLINLEKLCDAKRPGRLTQGVILLHDNATPHTAVLTRDWFRRYGWEIFPHPPHRPDLAPSDYHLFGPLKRHLGGQKFDTDEALINEVNDWMAKLDGTFFREGIHSLARRWQKCIDRQGDYIEK